jgi:hypothetical protein
MKNLLSILIVISFSSQAQKMKIIQGSLQGLKGQTSYDIKFSYDSMFVGRGIPENEYLDAVSARWELKEPGKGPAFVKMWFDDRQRLYEPEFVKNFENHSKIKLNDKNATYTLLLKTNSTEGGWDLWMEGSAAIIAGELWIVESADHSKVKARIRLRDSQGKDSNGGDFEMTTRIKSAYASAGKWLGIFILKHSE